MRISANIALVAGWVCVTAAQQPQSPAQENPSSERASRARPLPPSCSNGQLFVGARSPGSGQQVYVCGDRNQWIPVNGPGISVAEFGAKCDGSNDDTHAFQAAHDALPTGGTITIPTGVCQINGTIYIRRDNIKFRGAGQGASYLRMGPAVTRLFEIASGTRLQVVLPEFSDFSVDGSHASRGVAFYVAGARSLHVDRVYTVKCFRSYDVELGLAHDTSTFHLSSFLIEDTPDLPDARGILINGGGDAWFIRNGRLFQNAQSRENVGIELASGGGFMIDNVDVSSFGRAFVVAPPAGSFVRFGQINALQCDTSWGDNATLDGAAAFASGYPNGVYALNFVNSWFSSAGANGGDGNGLNIVSARSIVVDASQVYSNSLNGIRVQKAARDITLSHNQISANSNGFGNRSRNVGAYSGMLIEGSAEHILIDGNRSGPVAYNPNTQQYGLTIAGECASCVVIANDLTGNMAGDLKSASGSSADRQMLGNLPPQPDDSTAAPNPAVTGAAYLGKGVAFKDLGSAPNGTLVYCYDCARTRKCSGGGRGAIAKRLDNAWSCD